MDSKEFSFAKGATGFTLIELLVVIAIVAILSVVVILTLNPAELLNQARDSNRLSDISAIRSAVALYQSDLTQTSLAPDGGNACYTSTSTLAGGAGQCGDNGTPLFASAYLTQTTTTSYLGNRSIDGTGWVPLDFSSITAGSPFPILPADPVNDSNYYYAYVATSSGNGTFKVVAARLQSTRYGNGGSSDAVSNDGGTNANAFEMGTNLNL